MLLGYCAIVGTFRPHFEVLFAMSLGLSGCYIWYGDYCFSSWKKVFFGEGADLVSLVHVCNRLMFEMAKLPPRETEHGKKE